ncbi:MAG TPA: hypothetical protein EYQ24_04165 [Bacteroidetes bacterium]|nr:hypothetical protein [Bacteroidota bacterium]HIL57670.1 hypothetical protein [Rhodothermales bacterium]
MPARSWNSLADLDELVLACESEISAEYLDEAVACYRAGAYRAAIVATWVAVAYDYLDKLRELEFSGDGQAAAEIARWDAAHTSTEIGALLDLEREMLDTARNQFELLSEIEHDDLGRLQKDRHRCAHPSHDHAGEPYQPTAEQARAHIRNAVEHLLSRPPVQGRAALDQLKRDVDRASFPTDVDDAVRRLQMGPLAHARIVLVRNAAIVFMKGTLVDDDATSAQRERRRTALAAMHRMDTGEVEQAVFQRVNDVIARLPDEEWGHVFELLEALPVVWETLNEANQDNARSLVARAVLPAGAPVLRAALATEGLAEAVTDRASEYDADTLAALIDTHPADRLVDELIDRLGRPESYFYIRDLGDALRAALPSMGAAEIERVVGAYLSNDQFHGCGTCAPMMDAVMSRAAEIGGIEGVFVPVVDPYLERNYEEGIERYRGLYPEAVAHAEATRLAVATDGRPDE